jgi:hypothetical protein
VTSRRTLPANQVDCEVCQSLLLSTCSLFPAHPKNFLRYLSLHFFLTIFSLEFHDGNFNYDNVELDENIPEEDNESALEVSVGNIRYKKNKRTPQFEGRRVFEEIFSEVFCRKYLG